MEQIPLDYTGHGPTGIGYRPTVGAMRRQSENRFRTDRNSEAMAWIDPTVNAGIATAARVAVGAGNDPAKVREWSSNSTGAQAARDMLMFGRRSGFLGAGNPNNYSHNMTRGITSGGFTTDVIGKDPSGRSTLGLDQRVQGNGLLAERVTQRFQKGMLDELYGKDAATNPNKLNGFDMEEASGVAATIMRRGGVGKAATLVRGASAQLRVDSARDAALDSGIKEKLSKVNVRSNEELTKLAEVEKDPKMKAELTRLAKSTDTVVVNDGAHKKLAGVVREVTKGMAALSDMYGELSATELQQQLESITGKKIVNKQQAKAATGMVNSLRNGSESLGMDPRAFMDFVAQTQANIHQQYTQAGGFDERSNTATKETSAKITTKIAQDATGAAVGMQQAARDGEALGFNMDGTDKSVDEIALDMANQSAHHQAISGGEAMIRGGMNKISDPKARAKAEALLAAKDAATGPEERAALESQLKQLAGQQWGGPSMSYDAAAASNTGQHYKNKGYADDKQIAAARAADVAALNTSSVDDLTKKMGLEGADATKFSQRLVSKLGNEGMVDLAKIASQPDQIGDQKVTDKDRKDQIHNYLTKTAHMSEDDARDTASRMFGDDGRFKDAAFGQDLVERVSHVSWDGQSDANASKTTERNLAQRGENGQRKKIGDDGKGNVTIAGVVNAMIDGRIDGAEDPETMALTLAAMKKEGMQTMMVDEIGADGKPIAEKGPDGKMRNRQINALDGVETGIDMRDNISEETAAKLTKVNGGKDLGILKKFGWKSNAEMAEATKNSKVKADVLKYLDSSTDVTLTGGLENTTAVSDVATDSARNAKDGPAAAMRRLAAAHTLAGTKMEDGKDTAVTQAIKTGYLGKIKGAIAGEYAPDKVGYKTSEKWFSGGRQFTHMDNNRTFVNAAQNINEASDSEMKNIAELNTDGKLAKNMAAQLKSLKEAKALDIDTVIARDPVTGKEVTNNVDDSIAKLEAALAKLTQAGGGEAVTEMRVTNLHIDNVVDLKKS